MSADGSHEITQLLLSWGNGNQFAYDQLARLVYDELRRIAESQMRRERDGHTLSPSALVNEVFVKLSGCRQVRWQDRLHFFNFAARLMRQVLVNYAQAHKCGKRGGGIQRVTLSQTVLQANRSEMSFEELLELDAALESLGEEDERCAKVVELTFFGGLTVEETAEVLGVTGRTVKRDWRYARLWLRRELSREKESYEAEGNEIRP